MVEAYTETSITGHRWCISKMAHGLIIRNEKAYSYICFFGIGSFNIINHDLLAAGVGISSETVADFAYLRKEQVANRHANRSESADFIIHLQTSSQKFFQEMFHFS